MASQQLVWLLLSSWLTRSLGRLSYRSSSCPKHHSRLGSGYFHVCASSSRSCHSLPDSEPHNIGRQASAPTSSNGIKVEGKYTLLCGYNGPSMRQNSQTTNLKIAVPEMAKECKVNLSGINNRLSLMRQEWKLGRRLKRNSLHLLVLKPLTSSLRVTLRKPLIAIGKLHQLALLFLPQHFFYESTFSCTMQI